MNPEQRSLGELIPWLPDETLFSWCSRYHRLAVNGLASATCTQLFGARRRGVAHDMPSGIGVLARRAEGSLGTSMEICSDRTLLAFYAPFRPLALVERARAQLIDGDIGHLKYQLGMQTSGLGAAHPLKACPQCMTQDRRQSGVAHWRRVHQLPSSWFCATHKVPLLISPLKLDQRARFQWVLPAEAALVPWTNAPLDIHTREIGLRMAHLGAELCRRPAASFANEHRVADAFHAGLRSIGSLDRSGRVSWQALEPVLRGHAAALNALPPFAMQMDTASARGQMARILSGRSLSHPLRYVAWMSLPFTGLQQFMEAFGASRTSAGSMVTERTQVNAYPGVTASSAVLALLEEKESLSAIARRFGVDPSTVAAWAAKAGLHTSRRPKALDRERRDWAIAMLSDGADKRSVAQQIRMSEVTVTRMLRTVPGLQDRWHAARHDAAQARARQAWLDVVAIEAVLGRAAARRLAPSAFAWLFRNDREWLLGQSQSLASARRGNGAPARRQRADERYARSLASAFGSAQQSGHGFGVQVARWPVSAPGLKRVLRDPAAWPLTVNELRRLLASGAVGDEKDSLWGSSQYESRLA